MTPTEAIALAKEAGIDTIYGDFIANESVLLAFAKAIEARVREDCAAIVEQMPEQVVVFWDRPGGPPGNGLRPVERADIAAAIRDLPQTKK